MPEVWVVWVKVFGTGTYWCGAFCSEKEAADLAAAHRQATPWVEAWIERKERVNR